MRLQQKTFRSKVDANLSHLRISERGPKIPKIQSNNSYEREA
jgi:hypothetical protein